MNAISGGCSLNTSATTMRIARISAWGRKRRTAELIPTPLVSFCRRSDSAGCIIVTIGLPDPGSCFHPSLYIHATCARTRVLQWEWPLPRTLSVAFGLLLQVAAKRGGAIFRTDEILARDNHLGDVLLHLSDIHCSALEFLVVRLVRFPRSALIPLHHGEVFLPRVLERTPHGHEGDAGAAVDEQKDRVVHVLAAHFDPLLNSP